MADEAYNSGATEGKDQTDENLYDLDGDNDIKIAGLTRKIELLEQEKSDLIREYDEIKQRVEKLTAETEEIRSDKDNMGMKMEEMLKEIERAEADKKTLQVMAPHVLELETRLSRLEHDLITAETIADEANAEIVQLKIMLEKKEQMVEILGKQKELIEKEKDQNESSLRGLEEKIKEMEVKETKAIEEKVNIEQEVKEKIDQKDREISNLLSGVEELKSLNEHFKMQLKENQEKNNELKEYVKKCDEKMKGLESTLEGTRRSKEVTRAVQDTQCEGVNGIASHSDACNAGYKTSGLKWPVAIVSTGVVATVIAACYLRHRRQR